jgi:tRNA nucleotidyltransferase (CCA-adding enzyme)
VRDLLLKRDFKDIDIVAVGRNRIGFTRFKTTSINQSSSFKTYGTAMLRFEDTEIEFVGARKVLSI